MISAKVAPLTFSGLEAEAGLSAALGMSRAEVIAAIRDSGMKGRGGAGFPTGVKWNLAASVQDDEKYVICNADEGEPGTFKDRVHPDGIMRDLDLSRGMTIAGLCHRRAPRALMYLRAEYTYLAAGARSDAR